LKQHIVQEIDEFAPPHVIIGSSTSFIPLSLLRARAKKHPERVATVHPSLPQWDAFCEVLGSSEQITNWLALLVGQGSIETDLQGVAGTGESSTQVALPAVKGLGMDVVAMKKECHGHAFNTFFITVYSAATLLVKGGVCDAHEVNTALVHFARLVIAGGGFSGLLVGIVGGGSVQASQELTTDIYLGLPVAWGTVAISRLFPALLARFFLKIWQALMWPVKFLKAPVRRFVNWWGLAFYKHFDKHLSDKAAFEATAIQRMCDLEKECCT
jgi:hypothetical protein